MSTIFSLLFFTSFICLVIGLISPRKFSGFIKNATRKKIGLVFGGAIIALFFLIGATAPSSPETLGPQKEHLVEESITADQKGEVLSGAVEVEQWLPEEKKETGNESIVPKIEVLEKAPVKVPETNVQETKQPQSSAPSGDYYINVDGNKVPSPTYSSSIPAGATARCRDGTYSFSQNRRGTCSHHGGVAKWL